MGFTESLRLLFFVAAVRMSSRGRRVWRRRKPWRKEAVTKAGSLERIHPRGKPPMKIRKESPIRIGSVGVFSAASRRRKFIRRRRRFAVGRRAGSLSRSRSRIRRLCVTYRSRCIAQLPSWWSWPCCPPGRQRPPAVKVSPKTKKQTNKRTLEVVPSFTGFRRFPRLSSADCLVFVPKRLYRVKQLRSFFWLVESNQINKNEISPNIINISTLLSETFLRLNGICFCISWRFTGFHFQGWRLGKRRVKRFITVYHFQIKLLFLLKWVLEELNKTALIGFFYWFLALRFQVRPKNSNPSLLAPSPIKLFNR